MTPKHFNRPIINPKNCLIPIQCLEQRILLSTRSARLGALSIPSTSWAFINPGKIPRKEGSDGCWWFFFRFQGQTYRYNNCSRSVMYIFSHSGKQLSGSEQFGRNRASATPTGFQSCNLQNCGLMLYKKTEKYDVEVLWYRRPIPRVAAR